jgi:phospholipid/cholesterol/gamma-HCH transport system ATP-binding protein
MIEIKNVYKSYGSKAVLQNLSLTIQKGETLVILGRSGAGKSVLLKLLIGLDKPDSGQIIIDNKPINHLKGAELYKIIHHMGMLFQAGALFDSMTVGENTAFYLRQHRWFEGKKLSFSDIRKKASSALAKVGLEGTESLMPSDLSGGMRKRAALARLIAYHPHILLYDEPTTGLDPITAMQINELIVSIQKELQTTSIVVTHDLCSAFHVADRIAFNHNGQILYCCTKEEFAKITDPLVQNFMKNAIPNG